MSRIEPETNREWKRWGKIDPLWSVATWPGKKKGGKSPWTDEDFYKLGKSDWGDFSEHWTRYGVNREVCVEIGCGAGRLTVWLAGYFQRVFANDVSDDMLNYARLHTKGEKVIFQLVDGMRLPQADDSIDAIFSAHVFQHFETLDYATLYFSEAWRVLRTNGSIMIHLPIRSQQRQVSMTSSVALSISRGIDDLKFQLKRRLAEHGWIEPPMRSLEYPMGYLFSTLTNLGFREIEIQTFIVKSNNAIHSFVFARKGANL